MQEQKLWIWAGKSAGVFTDIKLSSWLGRSTFLITITKDKNVPLSLSKQEKSSSSKGQKAVILILKKAYLKKKQQKTKKPT